MFLENIVRTRTRLPEDPAARFSPFDFVTLSAADRDVIGVLPKVRTPSIGCTLRSLSLHLAVTPGQGVARGLWSPNFVPPAARGQLPGGQMNVLLVPFPYVVEAEAFCASRLTDARGLAFGTVPAGLPLETIIERHTAVH